MDRNYKRQKLCLKSRTLFNVAEESISIFDGRGVFHFIGSVNKSLSNLGKKNLRTRFR